MSDFQIKVHSQASQHVFDHITVDAAHAADLCHELSMLLPAGTKISVEAFARFWLTYDHGVLVAVRTWDQFYTSDDESADQESMIAVMLQNAPRKKGIPWRAVPVIDQTVETTARTQSEGRFCMYQ